MGSAVLKEPLGEGAHSLVYQARCRDQEVAVKVCRVEDPRRRAAATLRFRREAAHLARIEHPGVVKVHELGEAEDGRAFLVMELVEGGTLTDRLAGDALPATEVAQLGRSLAAALGAVHACGLVHRDLKPDNVLYTAEGAPKLIDFGLAVEHGSSASEEGVAGTFAYSAPEQTRMLDRPVDNRADLYSLGALLFEGLTGCTPFQADDVGELIRMHAHTPAPLAHEQGAEVPLALSRVVSKLLAKDPDDRYADAASLVADLDAYLDGKLAPDAALGTHRSEPDAVELSGRDEELLKLQQWLLDASEQGGGAFWLEGAKGAGCSSLAQVAERSSRWSVRLSGSPDANIPFAAFRQALRQYLADAPAGDLLQNAIGQYAPFLAKALPEAAEHLRLSAEDLRVEGNQDVHYDAVAELWLGLAQAHGGLLLVLSDVHALDTASSRTLARLIARRGEAPLALLVTSRSDLEDGQLLELRELQQGVEARLVLPPIDAQGVHAMLCTQLGQAEPDDALVNEVFQRSAGLPAAVLAYLGALFDEGLLSPCWGTWTLDRERLATLKLPDNVEALLLRRVEGLPEECRRVLAAAAVVGMTFDVQTLNALFPEEQREVRQALHHARLERLVDSERGDRWRFADEVCQRALYDGLAEGYCAALHGRIADRLAELESSDEQLQYELADHYYRGLNADNARAAYDANKVAGARALGAHAHEESARYLTRALAIAERNGLLPDFELHRDLGESLAAQGDMSGALGHMAKAEVLCERNAERAALQLRNAELHMWGDMEFAAIEPALQRAWASLGVRLPTSVFGKVLGILGYVLLGLFIEFTRIGFGRDAGKPSSRTHYRLSETTGSQAFLRNDLITTLYVSFRGYCVALWAGPSRELAWAYAARGNTLSSMGFPMSVCQKYADKAFAMAEQLRDPVAMARARQLYASAHFFQGELEEAERLYREVIERDGRWLDVADLVMAHVEIALNHRERGYEALGQQYLAERLLHIQYRVRGEDSRAQALDGVSAMLRCAGNKRELAEMLLADKEPPDLEGTPYHWFMYWSGVVAMRLMTDDLGADVDKEIERTERSGMKAPFASWHSLGYWVDKADVREQQYLRASAEDKAQRLSDWKAAVAELGQGARAPLHRCRLLVHQAGLALAAGEHDKALEHTSEAMRAAQFSDNAHGIYAAHLQRARVLEELQRPKAAIRDLCAALEVARAQSWVHRIGPLQEKLRKEAPWRVTRTAVTASRSTAGFATGTAEVTSRELQRDRDALLDVSLATARVVEPLEQARLALDALLNILGGDRACILLCDDSAGLTRLAARGADGVDLDPSEELPATLLERVRVEQEPIVLNGSEQGAELGSKSAVAQGLRSMICAPLMFGEQLRGVIYLDSRLAKGIFTRADLDILVAIAGQIAVSQEMALAAQSEIARRGLEKDLQLSAAVQSLLLPKQDRFAEGGLCMAAFFRPASSVAGDWWFYDRLPDGTLQVVVADVTGHGAGSAMVASAMAGCFHAHSREQHDGMQPTLRSLHDTLRRLCEGRYTMTVCALELDPRTGKLDWWSAAAEPGLVLNGAGEARTLLAKGEPLGSDEFVVGHVQDRLSRDERLLMCTDGVVELELPSGHQLGLRRLSKLLRRTRELSVADARQALVQDMDSKRGDGEQQDDITFVLIERGD